MISFYVFITGVFGRMVDETKYYIKSQKDGSGMLKLLDARMEELFSVGFIPNFKQLRKVRQCGTSTQANDYKPVMQVILDFFGYLLYCLFYAK